MKTEYTEIRILGTTEEFTTCSCCGKAGLKKTVAIEFDGMDIQYWGTECAKKVYRFVNGSRNAILSESVEIGKRENRLEESRKGMNREQLIKSFIIENREYKTLVSDILKDRHNGFLRYEDGEKIRIAKYEVISEKIMPQVERFMEKRRNGTFKSGRFSNGNHSL